MKLQHQFASAPSGDGFGQPRVNFRSADAFVYSMEIPLTNGGVALIDDADYPLVRGRTWRWRQSGRIRYAESHHDGRPENTKRRLRVRTFMHRIILGLSDPKTCCDHINRNGLDNRRCNLRPATRSQNMANRNKTVKNSTGFKGVVYLRRRRVPTWTAQIGVMYRVVYLGRFQTPEDAARAYDKAALFFFGDFANINFPQRA